MKNVFKKLAVAMSVISVVFTVSVASVFAAPESTVRPMPGETTTSTDVTKSGKSDGNTITAKGGAADVTQSVDNQETSAKKYLTKWGGFFWFLLSVVVNFILSCWISNRFYRLAKRNTQGSAEIRALRKDIEEKFASTLVDINEPITEVINTNESYARTDDGIEMPERKPVVEINDEEREILGRWDMKRTAEKQAEAEEKEDRYEMRRPMAGIQFEDEGDEPEADAAPAEPSKIEKASNRAKDIISNIFPFDEQ